jgi:hypothetical protein
VVEERKQKENPYHPIVADYKDIMLSRSAEILKLKKKTIKKIVLDKNVIKEAV